MNISSVVPSSDIATDTMTDFEKVDRVRRSSADTCLFWLPSGAYMRSFWIGIFHIGNFCFWVPFLKQLLLRNFAVDFVEICNVYIGKMIIKAAKRIFNSGKIWRSYSDLNFGVTFFGTQCITVIETEKMKELTNRKIVVSEKLLQHVIHIYVHHLTVASFDWSDSNFSQWIHTTVLLHHSWAHWTKVKSELLDTRRAVGSSTGCSSKQSFQFWLLWHKTVLLHIRRKPMLKAFLCVVI